MSLIVEPISQQEFDSMRQDWNDLLARSTSDTVFLRWEWIHTWWTHFQQNRQLLIVAARRDGALVGIAPFFVEQPARFGPRLLQFCSTELAPDYLDLIVAPGEEGEVAPALVRQVLSQRDQWDKADLRDLRPDALLLTYRTGLTQYRTEKSTEFVCPYIPIDGDFETYCAGRRSSGLSSSNLKQRERILFTEKGVTLRRCTEESLLREAMEQLFELHDQRKRVQNCESAFTAPGVRRFHLDLSRQFLSEKILDLRFLMAGSKPVSVSYGFNYHRRAYYFQSGYDPDWSRLSVGAVLLRLTIQDAFREGFKEFDFLKGEESYKRLWTQRYREEIEWIVYNKNARGALEGTLAAVRNSLRGIKRSLMPPLASPPLAAQPSQTSKA
jgi:CelD/BcsL family acetyltransferase involved in cellulose biosynthesis